MTHGDGRVGAGQLLRIDSDGTTLSVLNDLTLPNGIAWDPGGTKMYFVESAERALYVFDFDPTHSTIVNRRCFLEFPPEWGIPDGIAVDADGSIWVAFYGGMSVRRFSSVGGLQSTVRMGTAEVTSCCFGGAELNDVYVTTGDWNRSGAPGAGGLYCFRAPVHGLASTCFGG
jgi:sugar lactone lactonase YvrE